MLTIDADLCVLTEYNFLDVFVIIEYISFSLMCEWVVMGLELSVCFYLVWIPFMGTFSYKIALFMSPLLQTC